MSTSFMASGIQGTNPIDDFVASVTRRFDANGDGNLSTAEFSGFLTQFLGTLGTGLPTASGAAASPTGGGPATNARVPVGTLAGFDATKLADPAVTSFKYQIGRILQFYPNTAAGLRDALPEIQQLVPGATIVGDDKLDFGTYADPQAGRIGTVDVIQAVHGDRGGVAWQWAPIG